MNFFRIAHVTIFAHWIYTALVTHRTSTALHTNKPLHSCSSYPHALAVPLDINVLAFELKTLGEESKEHSESGLVNSRFAGLIPFTSIIFLDNSISLSALLGALFRSIVLQKFTGK